jgi:hypothetical protein
LNKFFGRQIGGPMDVDGVDVTHPPQLSPCSQLKKRLKRCDVNSKDVFKTENEIDVDTFITQCKSKFRVLELPNFILNPQDLYKFPPDAVKNIWLIVKSIALTEVREVPEPHTPAGVHQGEATLTQLLSAFWYISVKSPFHWIDIRKLLSESLNNLVELAFIPSANAAKEIEFIGMHTPGLKIFYVRNEEPVKILWLRVFDDLERLEVEIIQHDEPSGLNHWVLNQNEELVVHNCDPVESYMFLKTFVNLTIIVLEHATKLRVANLQPVIQAKLQTLTLTNAYNAVTDELIDVLIQQTTGSLCELNVPLQPCNRCIGFSPGKLLEFLGDSTRIHLERLNIQGHPAINEAIWSWPVDIFRSMTDIDVRDTGIKGMEGLDIFSKGLHSYKQSNAKRIGIRKPNINPLKVRLSGTWDSRIGKKLNSVNVFCYAAEPTGS